MDENKFTNEENVTVDTEEVNAAVEEAAEEADAVTEEKAEGIVEELGAVVEGIAKEVDVAADEFASETKAALEEAEVEVDEESEDLEEDAETSADEFAKQTKEAADDIVARVKALVKEGNVTFIRIRKDNTVVLNLPMTVGIIGTVIGLAAAPWMVIVATITTIGLKCTVEVEKKDGTIVTIHGKGNKDE